MYCIGIYNYEQRRYTQRQWFRDVSHLVADNYIREALTSPDTWVAPPIGDPCIRPPPSELTTSVKLLYEQLGNHFCLTYSFASALWYCGFRDEAIELSKQARPLSCLSMNVAIAGLRSLMTNLVPAIGLPTVLGKRCNGNNKRKRPFTWDHLFSDITPYPTLVIPVTATGRMTHCFTVVDDLLFDSISPYALKLRQDTIEWIFNDEDVSIFYALRFNMKVSPKNHKLKCKYNRKVCLHN